MTKQEMFDKVVDRLRDGTGRAGTINRNHFICEYLDSKGKKCAIGIFIPDGHPGQKERDRVSILLKIHPDHWIYYSK